MATKYVISTGEQYVLTLARDIPVPISIQSCVLSVLSDAIPYRHCWKSHLAPSTHACPAHICAEVFQCFDTLCAFVAASSQRNHSFNDGASSHSNHKAVR